MKKPIKRIFIITHFLYELANAEEYAIKGEELERAIESIGKKAKGFIDGIAKNPENLLVVVRTDFTAMRPGGTVLHPAPGATRTHSEVLNHARDKMSERVVFLPPEAGYSRVAGPQGLPTEEAWFKIYSTALKKFSFSDKVRVSYTGEIPGWCPKTSALRTVKTLKKLFGIKVSGKRFEELPVLSFTTKKYKTRFTNALAINTGKKPRTHTATLHRK